MIHKQLYVISCSFQIEKDGVQHMGIAICEDVDTPITFMFASGYPYCGETVWNYRLNYHEPWATMNVVPI